MIYRYIGDDTIFHNLVPCIDKQLVNGKCYDVELQIDSPQIIVNGQAIAHPDATVWVVFPDKNIRMPYAPDLVDSQWRVMEDDSSR